VDRGDVDRLLLARAQIPCRIGSELGPASRAAEMERSALVLVTVPGRARVHLHAADRVNRQMLCARRVRPVRVTGAAMTVGVAGIARLTTAGARLASGVGCA
jgi:hypothetical protein